LWATMASTSAYWSCDCNSSKEIDFNRDGGKFLCSISPFSFSRT
jgi:hypothetical protein